MRFIKFLFILPALLAFAGCSTVSMDDSGKSQATYTWGNFKMLINGTSPETYDATLKALEPSNLFETTSKIEKFSAEIKARARDDQKVSIEIAEVNSRQTLITIRWGSFGDKNKSRALYHAIAQNMPR